MSTHPRAEPEIRELRLRLQAALGSTYAVGAELGSGATGTVFAAHDSKHDRQVAIKVLRPDLSASVGADRFLREIRIAARLNHPHIVPLHDSGDADGLLFYVMALEEGESLRTVLEEKGRLPVSRAVMIAREIAEALGHAHASGVVHRDIKPANVLLTGSHAVLTDFGVAHAVGAAADDLTRTGVSVGTPAYMSPEQAAGDETLDGRSDLYSLGCVLWEMLAGYRPLQGRSAVAALADRVTGKVPDIRDARPEVSAGLAAALKRALAARPEDRFQDAAAFIESLTGAVRPPVRWKAPVGVVVAMLLLGALAVRKLPLFGSPSDLSDGEGSVVVLPYGDAITTPDEGTLVIDLADELTRQLNRWDAVRAVPQVSLQGVTFDLGIQGPLLHRIDDGFETAGSLGVGMLVTLTVRIRTDSAIVTATRYDPRRRRPIGRPLEAQGPVGDPFRLAAQIAHGILGLTGPVDAVENLRRQSSNPAALLSYEEGRQLMSRWRIEPAETALRRAVALDSTFAMAMHYLALDLYWQAAREPLGLARLGPEAARLSRAALRHADGLPARERAHVEAFDRFLEGDYQAAREGYDMLLARDSTDVDAWLLRGIVEFQDPWLVEGPDGALRPRGDMNRAERSFLETIRLSPSFHLGYGHLFDITDKVLRNARLDRIQGFERPRDELIPPWEPATNPESQLAFGLVALDSLVWMPDSVLRATPRATLTSGADRLLQSSLRTLRRWTAYAPEEPRPHYELARWIVRQRALLDAPQRPERLDSLARVALREEERALALSADTVPADLVRLANRALATGDASRGRDLVRRAAAGQRAGGALLPRSTSNPFLHAGRWEDVLELLPHEALPQRRFWPNAETGEMMNEGGAESVVRRLQILGAAGAPAHRVTSALADLEAGWATPHAGAAPVPFLRRVEAPLIAPALALVPDALAAWRADAELTDPLWAAVDPETADRAEAVRAALGYAASDIKEPARFYLLGCAAIEIGDAALAVRLLSRLDSIPLSVEDRDTGWGLRALSLFRRGEAWEALGDPAKATDFFRSFLETRASDDDSAPFAAAARGRLERLAHGG